MPVVHEDDRRFAVLRTGVTSRLFGKLSVQVAIGAH